MLLVILVAVAALVIIVAATLVVLRVRAARTSADTRQARVGTGRFVDDSQSRSAAQRPSLRQRMAQARDALAGALSSIRSRSSVDQAMFDELEEALLRADVGVATSAELIEAVRARAETGEIETPEQALAALRADLVERLGGHERSLGYGEDSAPTVWLFVGVNGVGKTTSIAKLAKRETDAGNPVLLAAGDTFRAAAVEQLDMWAERAGVGIVKGTQGADPSSVIYDAVESAAAKGARLVLADTAGRLHTKTNLMDELRKVRRVAESGAGVVTETLLVIDATTGQNGLTQARQFTEAVDVTGVILTKLDGSARGGIVVAIQDQLAIPVKLVGLGEGIDDLVEFDEAEFVDALFG